MVEEVESVKEWRALCTVLARSRVHKICFVKVVGSRQLILERSRGEAEEKQRLE